MSWMDIINLLKNIGFFGFIVWGVQRIITNSADKKMENFRSEIEVKNRKLQSELDIERDKLKVQIEEIKWKNSKLHDKQAEIIEFLYNKLVNLDKSIRKYTAIVKLVPIDELERKKTEKQQLTDVEHNFTEFLDYFESNKIFFNEKICKAIEELISIYNDKMHDYIFSKDLIREGMELSDIKEELKKSHEAAIFIKREMPSKLKIIEDEFRKILTVNS